MDGNKRVLIIEDDQNLCSVIKTYLENVGYIATSEYNGKAGLEAAKKEFYDVMIIDIALPGLNGIDIIKSIRALNIQTPIIVITDRVTEQNEINAFEFGANIFHSKPIRYGVLETQIKSLIKEKNLIKIGDIEVDPVGMYLTKKGEEVEITPREFKLLMLFLKNSRNVLSREFIIHELYKDEVVEPGAIDTSVSRLRKILGECESQDIIETVYKSGYRINPICFNHNHE